MTSHLSRKTISPHSLYSLLFVISFTTIINLGCAKPKEVTSPTKPVPPVSTSQKEPKEKKTIKWVSLFDGKTLKGWKLSNFGGEGEVEVKEGVILMDFGSDLTGIHTDRKLPTVNYEVELQAKLVEGNDFFCGFTFPVKKESCSLILGGWGGATVGLSSIDNMDASENDTTQYLSFKTDQWYKIRVRVTETSIDVWLDGKSIIEQPTAKHKFSIRPEVDPSLPFGFCCFQTRTGYKDIRIRELTKEEIATLKKIKPPKPTPRAVETQSD